MAKIVITISAELFELAPNYLQNRIRDLDILKDALTRKDLAAIAKLSHKTKGSAGGYGFGELGVLAKKLELAAKSQDLEETGRVLIEMKNHLDRVEIRSVEA